MALLGDVKTKIVTGCVRLSNGARLNLAIIYVKLTLFRCVNLEKRLNRNIKKDWDCNLSFDWIGLHDINMPYGDGPAEEEITKMK